MRPEKIEDWLLEAVELMVQNGLSLKQASMDLGQDKTAVECELILRRRSFNKLLWEARHRYFSSVGNSPNFKKETVIGKLLDLATKLEAEGKLDKAANSLFQAAKIAGFVGPESTVSVFGELSQKDLEALRDTIKNEPIERVN